MAEFEGVTLKDPASSMTATFVPVAGMVGTSLADAGDEFLGQRRGLDAYVKSGKTMGIPILYPWANRLSASKYAINGAVVTLTPGTGGVRTDEHGVPIHGVLGGYPGWLITARSENSLTAVLDYGGKPRLLASFPFPHLLTQSVTLKDRKLTIETTVMPTTSASVPLCFGYHPYFTIPGVPREQWRLTTPTMRRLSVDHWGIPTGEHREWNGATEPLKHAEYDDGFDNVPNGAVFSVSGGDRRIDIRFEAGYPAAQIFAPRNDDVVCIEPMAAPTDSLRRGTYRYAVPGKPETARFSITVT
ncbi:aldose 1-epimerase [Mycolicibacterium elephantis]|uniref:Aldose 1-epimerase n=2 Tax=Mycolicibacterium elephantis TaxID=81858 RepID=A0A439DNW7_9MYCO|nr:aldose 1-epimerase [Mycolicibacterium elephantis]KKW63173.1 aldose epimerase [Mycolicibacterium elephantis]MCV7219530.1 aldose 1-epimerase [Mycolicibacterium elephantis]OBB24858.1 aldose epimerase [Mycolicibacterium elephantis]OBE98743.1 aldose epimerase [Mycolicibacterium elephantis]ORA61860.1 aldose epimerase [Mycolicibacterium elephantis]